MIASAGNAGVPNLFWSLPFVMLLLSIAVLPTYSRTYHWWHRNINKLITALVLGAMTLLYYQFRGWGIHLEGEDFAAGWPTVKKVLEHAVLDEYIPFISLLLSLYIIAGGIRIGGDLAAHPATNTAFLAIGGLLASLIGTTGASILLIRPLLATNAERARKVHTVIFFIFIVSNIGGTLLPIGDPPLFLGYLRGVPFLWTLGLWKEWLFCGGILLLAYYIWDRIEYARESPEARQLDESAVQKLSIDGKINFLWMVIVVLATGSLDPGKGFLGSDWKPPMFLREGIQLLVAIISLATTPAGLRAGIGFNYEAIVEVACLFIGIFLCMQVPIEVLHVKGPQLGLDSPVSFFWATGVLSSVLDNAPTYMVFFETANSLTQTGGPGITQLMGGDFIREDLLVAISLGAVFMGALSYIGNGPNFMVKSIAERSGVKMPSFFQYMIFSSVILLPLFVAVTFLFLW